MIEPTLALIPSAYKGGSPKGTLYSVLPSNGVGDFDFSRITYATRINKDGLIERVDSNVPRLNYPLIDGVVSGCPSLLLESASTNLLPYSEDFDNAAWSKTGATITLSSELSPMGMLNAYDVVYTSGGFILETVSTTKTIGSSETISVFSKSDIVGTFLKFGGGTASGTDVEKKEDYGNGWFRYSVTRTFTEAETGGTQLIISSTEVGLNVVLFGAQLEQGYLTSYIPSLIGSATTRSAEICNNAGDVNTFNDSEGVLMAEISALADDGTSRRISLSNGSTSQRVSLELDEVSNNLRMLVVNSTFQVDMGVAISDTTNFNKIALKYKENDFALWVNGIELITSNSGLTPIGLSTLSFDASVASAFLYGNTKQLQYFDTALNDTSLEELTSWRSFNEMARDLLYTIL